MMLDYETKVDDVDDEVFDPTAETAWTDKITPVEDSLLTSVLFLTTTLAPNQGKRLFEERKELSCCKDSTTMTLEPQDGENLLLVSHNNTAPEELQATAATQENDNASHCSLQTITLTEDILRSPSPSCQSMSSGMTTTQQQDTLRKRPRTPVQEDQQRPTKWRNRRSMSLPCTSTTFSHPQVVVTQQHQRRFSTSQVSLVEHTDWHSPLHRACRLHSTNLIAIKDAYISDPSGMQRPIQRQERHDYAYPINIALKHGATIQVIQFLAQKAPSILLKKDGPIEASSLGIALQEKVVDLEILECLLRANPDCARMADRHQNLPIHLAVRSPQVSWRLVERLLRAYPLALQKRNFRSETPLDVAIRSPFCPEAIVDCLHVLSYSNMEADLEEEERIYSESD